MNQINKNYPILQFQEKQTYININLENQWNPNLNF